jgi:hypothetical protein
MCRKYMWESKWNDIFNEDEYIIRLSVGDGVRYYMRGCALRGRVSRKQGRDCIERVGMYFE